MLLCVHVPSEEKPAGSNWLKSNFTPLQNRFNFSPCCSDVQVDSRMLWHHCWVGLKLQQSTLLTTLISDRNRLETFSTRKQTRAKLLFKMEQKLFLWFMMVEVILLHIDYLICAVYATSCVQLSCPLVRHQNNKPKMKIGLFCWLRGEETQRVAAGPS